MRCARPQGPPKRWPCTTRCGSRRCHDRKLGVFRVNVPLDAESYEIGRARAFAPGWLENESILLHMDYKYLLEILRGATRRVLRRHARGLVPFLDPDYGRSPGKLILHCQQRASRSIAARRGFVARLSGATAEFLSIWPLMMAGPRPFSMRDGESA